MTTPLAHGRGPGTLPRIRYALAVGGTAFVVLAAALALGFHALAGGPVR